MLSRDCPNTMGSHAGTTKSQHGVACVLTWWSTEGKRSFRNSQIATLLQCHRRSCKGTRHQTNSSICFLPVVRTSNRNPSRSGPQRRLCRLARRRLAWRAGSSPGAPEARLASRRLALVSSAFKKKLVARLARRRLALVSSAFQNSLARRRLALVSSVFPNNQLSLASQGQPKSTHFLQGHRPPRGILISTLVK